MSVDELAHIGKPFDLKTIKKYENQASILQLGHAQYKNNQQNKEFSLLDELKTDSALYLASESIPFFLLAFSRKCLEMFTYIQNYGCALNKQYVDKQSVNNTPC